MDTETLRKTKEALDIAIAEKRKAEELIKSLGPAIIDAINPVLDEIARNSKFLKEELLSAISNIKINVPKSDVPQAQVDVRIPEIKVPEPKVTVNVPEIKVPKIPRPEVTVNFDASKIKIPDIKIPDLKMPKEMLVKGNVGIEGNDRDKPMFVIMVDEKGQFVKMAPNISVSGFGGGAASNSSFNGLSVPAYDYVLVEYPGATTETYSLKLGGQNGEVVCTLQMIYADTAKNNLKTVKKL
jgi:hypothetical protein